MVRKTAAEKKIEKMGLKMLPRPARKACEKNNYWWDGKTETRWTLTHNGYIRAKYPGNYHTQDDRRYARGNFQSRAEELVACIEKQRTTVQKKGICGKFRGDKAKERRETWKKKS